MNRTDEPALAITHAAHIGEVRRVVRAVASEAGFQDIEVEEIVLVSVELATNLLKHTSGGALNVSGILDGERSGIEISTSDKGPGFDVNRAVEDRYSTAGTLGAGLGAVNRLMDEMHVTCGTDGALVTARRWVRPGRQLASPCPFSYGVASRPRLGQRWNGDSFAVRMWDGGLLAGVIDGLGHGEAAHQAAEAARHHVETHWGQSLEGIFDGVDRACRATRGVVMTLAWLSWTQGGARRVALAGVGNVEAHVLGPAPRPSFVVQRGLLGNGPVVPRVTVEDWNPGWTLVIHSDGLQPRWRDTHAACGAPGTMAWELLKRHGNDNDDTTVVVVASKEPVGRWSS